MGSSAQCSGGDWQCPGGFPKEKRLQVLDLTPESLTRISEGFT